MFGWFNKKKKEISQEIDEYKEGNKEIGDVVNDLTGKDDHFSDDDAHSRSNDHDRDPRNESYSEGESDTRMKTPEYVDRGKSPNGREFTLDQGHESEFEDLDDDPDEEDFYPEESESQNTMLYPDSDEDEDEDESYVQSHQSETLERINRKIEHSSDDSSQDANDDISLHENEDGILVEDERQDDLDADTDDDAGDDQYIEEPLNEEEVSEDPEDIYHDDELYQEVEKQRDLIPEQNEPEQEDGSSEKEDGTNIFFMSEVEVLDYLEDKYDESGRLPDNDDGVIFNIACIEDSSDDETPGIISKIAHQKNYEDLEIQAERDFIDIRTILQCPEDKDNRVVFVIGAENAAHNIGYDEMDEPQKQKVQQSIISFIHEVKEIDGLSIVVFTGGETEAEFINDSHELIELAGDNR